MSIEDLVKMFSDLANKQNLLKSEHEEARKLMRQLKEAGMSNDEISEISEGKWSTSTIKFYTPRTKATQPSQWQDAVSLLENIISKGMTLEDVELTVNVNQFLKDRELTLEQTSDLLIDADFNSINLRALVNMHEGLKESGLAFKDIAEIQSFKKELEARKFTTDSLVPLVELAKNYGEPAKIIEALSQYISLNELNSDIARAKGDLESVNQELASTHQNLDVTRSELSKVKEPLKAHEEVKKLGFGEPELLKLTNLTNKYGTVKKVLNAVEGYADNAEINEEINRAKTRLANLEAKIGQLETSYSHLKTATNMCDALIHEHKFGLDAITTIFATAKKYGDPLELLKAIETYGKLQALQQEVIKLQSKLTEIKTILVQSEGKYQEMLEKIESLNATALEVGVEVGKVEGELSASRQWRTLMNLVQDPASADYATYGSTALVLTVALLKWVSSNEGYFKPTYDIKPGLQSLIKQLGGVW